MWKIVLCAALRLMKLLNICFLNKLSFGFCLLVVFCCFVRWWGGRGGGGSLEVVVGCSVMDGCRWSQDGFISKGVDVHTRTHTSPPPFPSLSVAHSANPHQILQCSHCFLWSRVCHVLKKRCMTKWYHFTLLIFYIWSIGGWSRRTSKWRVLGVRGRGVEMRWGGGGGGVVVVVSVCLWGGTTCREPSIQMRT